MLGTIIEVALGQAHSLHCKRFHWRQLSLSGIILLSSGDGICTCERGFPCLVWQHEARLGAACGMCHRSQVPDTISRRQ